MKPAKIIGGFSKPGKMPMWIFGKLSPREIRPTKSVNGLIRNPDRSRRVFIY